MYDEIECATLESLGKTKAKGTERKRIGRVNLSWHGCKMDLI